MKIALYGGSFNPVHFGHVGLARWVVEHTDVDEVWLMVSPSNPLKNADELAPEQERLAGVQRAIDGIPGLRASDFEFNLPRPSYTANTLRQLTKVYPQHEFILLIGEDNWQLFRQWRDWEYILSRFRIFIYPRHTSSPCTVHRPPSPCTVHCQPSTDTVHCPPSIDIVHCQPSTFPPQPSPCIVHCQPSIDIVHRQPSTDIVHCPPSTLNPQPSPCIVHCPPSTFTPQPSPCIVHCPPSTFFPPLFLSSAPYFDISSTQIRLNNASPTKR